MKKSILFLCLALFSFIIFGGSVNAAEWPSNLPAKPDAPSTVIKHPEFVVYKLTDGNIFCVVSGLETYGIDYSSLTQPYVDFVSVNSGSVFYLKIKAKTRYNIFKLVDNAWESINPNGAWHLASNVGQILSITTSVDHFIYADHDILTEDGKLVFPLPPVLNPTLTEILEGTTIVETKTVGTMKTITIVAVSCLALLIGLHLLPKVLYRFLAR